MRTHQRPITIATLILIVGPLLTACSSSSENETAETATINEAQACERLYDAGREIASADAGTTATSSDAKEQAAASSAFADRLTEIGRGLAETDALFSQGFLDTADIAREIAMDTEEWAAGDTSARPTDTEVSNLTKSVSNLNSTCVDLGYGL